LGRQSTARQNLSRVRRLAHEGRYAFTARVQRYLATRSWDSVYVGECLCSLRASDLEKSVPDDRRPDGQLDIYRPYVGGRRLYITFTIDDEGDLYVLSFCRDGDRHEEAL
jgi:hypothetical protein